MENKETITLTLSVDETNLILRGLGELPAKESIQLIQNIHQEWTRLQQQKQNEPVARQHLQEVSKDS